jgi:hypothetical protein
MVGSVLRSIWKMRPDGTDDAQAWPMPVFYLSYAVAANALYGVVARDPVRRYFSVQSIRPSDGMVYELLKLEFQAGLSLSVSPDERYLLLAQKGTDLMLMEGFR